MSNGKVIINNNQFKAILVCGTWPTAINYASGILARQVGRDMWISGAISVLYSVLFIFIVTYIGHNFPGKTIVEYSQDLLSTIPGKLLGLVLSFFFFLASVNAITMYIHHLTDFLLPETPFLVVTALHVCVLTYFVWKGPEVIARMGVIGFATAIFFYFLVFLASLSEINFNRLRPFFNSGFLAVGRSTLSVDTFVGLDQLIVAMLLPMVREQKKAFRSGAAGLLIGGSFFVFYFIVELMVMGPQVVPLMRIASMDFVRSIQITQYLHRFEAFMVALWYWSILVQAGTSAYCSLAAFYQVTGIKKKMAKNVLVIVYGIFSVIGTYLIGFNRAFFLNFRESMWQYIALPIMYGLPLILLLILGFKKAWQAVKNSTDSSSSQ